TRSSYTSERGCITLEPSMVAVLALILAAGPSPRLAAGGFTPVGMEPARAQFFSDYFADQLNASGRVRVVTQSEMAALLGCSGEGSCLAELAGALDAAGLIAAQLDDWPSDDVTWVEQPI